MHCQLWAMSVISPEGQVMTIYGSYSYIARIKFGSMNRPSYVIDILAQNSYRQKFHSQQIILSNSCSLLRQFTHALLILNWKPQEVLYVGKYALRIIERIQTYIISVCLTRILFGFGWDIVIWYFSLLFLAIFHWMQGSLPTFLWKSMLSWFWQFSWLLLCCFLRQFVG